MELQTHANHDEAVRRHATTAHRWHIDGIVAKMVLLGNPSKWMNGMPL